MLHIVSLTFGPNRHFVCETLMEYLPILSKYLYDEIPIDFQRYFFEFKWACTVIKGSFGIRE